MNSTYGKPVTNLTMDALEEAKAKLGPPPGKIVITQFVEGMLQATDRNGSKHILVGKSAWPQIEQTLKEMAPESGPLEHPFPMAYPFGMPLVEDDELALSLISQALSIGNHVSMLPECQSWEGSFTHIDGEETP